MSGDGGPATAEASDLLAPAHDQDATPIPQDRGDDGRGPHAREFHGPPGAVEEDPVAVRRTALSIRFTIGIPARIAPTPTMPPARAFPIPAGPTFRFASP